MDTTFLNWASGALVGVAFTMVVMLAQVKRLLAEIRDELQQGNSQ